MSSILLLEDGRALCRSNMGYCGMLELVAAQISDSQPRLRRWLADMAERTPPFCQIDLRGLDDAHREEFWWAAARARASLVRRWGPPTTWPDNMYAGESLAHLLQMHRSIQSGEPPAALNDLHDVIAFGGRAEDLDLLWASDE